MAIRAKHYSLRTGETYGQWIRRFIVFHDKRHPQAMGATEVQQFLTDLAVTHQAAASTQNQALSAGVFLSKEVLHHDFGWLDEEEATTAAASGVAYRWPCQCRLWYG